MAIDGCKIPVRFQKVDFELKLAPALTCDAGP